MAERAHAVVLGASMAGLLAARVLSESFAEVTLVERDDLSVQGDRRGVPQGRHVHALLARGRRIFEELFPGITEELLADGAVDCRSLTEMRMTIAGHTLSRSDDGYSLLQASRPFLEWRLRNRVRDLANVTVVDRCSAVGLTVDAAGARVTGVLVEPEDAPPREFPADLVVGCLGRHGPTDDWLAGLGYRRPDEEGVRIDMMYASRYVRLPHGSVGGDKEIVVANQEPARGLALFAVEDGMHILTLIGYGNDHPPTNSEDWWRFASSVAPPDVREALLDAVPLGEISTYRYLANRRRRYERLTRFPEGLLVFGDAVCSFSPAFGQGMTVSALQALRLREVLAAGDHDLASRYFRAAASAIDDAWAITKLFDLAMPHVNSAGQVPSRALGALTRVGMAVGARDATVGRQIARIAGLLDRPTAVLRPSLLGHGVTALAGVGVDHLRALRNTTPRSGEFAEFDPTPHGPARGFHRLAVRSVVHDTADSVVVEFDIPERLRERYVFAAGQHVVVRGLRHGQPIRRSYSLCDAATSGRVRIAVKAQPDGAFSGFAVRELTAGTSLHVSEPTGTFGTRPARDRPRDYVAVAAGSGITPVISLVATILGVEPESRVILHYGSRDRDRIMLARQVDDLLTRFPERLRVTHHLSGQAVAPGGRTGGEYRHGRIDPAEVAKYEADQWFLCGPKELVAEMALALRDRGIDRSRIETELFETHIPEVTPVSTDTGTSTVTLTGYGADLDVEVPRTALILDAALRQREDLPYSCLGGSCGTCLATVESGRVRMEPDPLLAITSDEIDRGLVLACRARPVSDEVTLRFGR
ncbi:2Fe-2S iron-sulfur cluster-binding protein [Nocardia aurea]|uniref:2Fe-2S iron-sulfur cluster-binding protein n=1 Tax=Nocardia aurea TaxID=2144174 RepID=UPI0033A4EDB1